MSGAAGLPAWYWARGLHDARLLSAELQDDTLILKLDSRGAIFDDSVTQIVFLGARLKTPLPSPGPKQPFDWLSDVLSQLPNGQWKLSIKLQAPTRKACTPDTLLTLIFDTAVVTRRG